MAGNLCRCGCYEQIFEAIRTTADGAEPMTGDPSGRLAQPRRRHRPRHRRPAVPRRPPGRGRAPREAGDAGLRAGADPGHRRLRGARPARRPPGHDRGRPAHAHAPVRAAERRTGRSSPWARPSTTATPWRWSSPTPATWPRRPPGSSGWSTRSCRRCSRSPAPSRRMRRSSRIPSLRAGDRLAGGNVLAEHRVGWGDVDAEAAACARRGGGPLHVPDGDPLRHRAACVHGGARRRRHRGLEHDPAPELAPEADRRPGEDAAVEGPGLRPGSRGRLRRQAAHQARAGGGLRGAQGRSPGPARPDPRGDVPGRPPGRLRVPGADRVRPRRRGSCSRTSRPTTSSAPTRTSPTGSWARARTRPPGRTTFPAVRILARSILSHTVPSTAFRGFGNPQINWAVESHARRGREGAGHRPARDPPAQPGPQGRPVHPVRHALRRGLGADGPARRRADRVGDAPARGPRPRDRAGHQVRPDHRPQLLHRPAPGRRLRGRLRRHVRHGAGRPDRPRADRRAGAGCAARLGHGRHGRHRGGALRPADLGLALHRPDGQLRPRGLPRHPGQAADDGGAAPRGGRGRRRGGRGRGPPARRPSSCTPLEVLRPGLGRLGGELTGLGETRKDAEPGHPLGGSRRVLRVQLHGHRGRGGPRDRRRDDRPPRHRQRRRQGHQPAPGPDAGRGRGDHGPRPHAHGALHLRRAGPDPEPRRHRLPDPHQHGPAARAPQRDGGERRRAGALRRQGHERGRAAVRRPRRGGRRPRGRPASRSATCR